MGAELWKKLASEDTKRFEVLADIAWRHLMAEGWSVDLQKCRFGSRVPEPSRGGQGRFPKA